MSKKYLDYNGLDYLCQKLKNWIRNEIANSSGGSGGNDELFKFQDFSVMTSLVPNGTGAYNSDETLEIPEGYEYFGILPYSTPYRSCEVTYSLPDKEIVNGTKLQAIVTNRSSGNAGGRVKARVIYKKKNS